MPLNQVDISMMQDIPAPGVAGKIIISDGTDWTSGVNSPVGSIIKQATDPTVSDPTTPTVGDMILNQVTGELFTCTTVSVGANVWTNTRGPAVPAADLTPAYQAIATLGLHMGVADNKVAFNLPNSFIDVFQDSTGITTTTDVLRNASEYISTVSVVSGAYADDVNTNLLLHFEDTGLTDSSATSAEGSPHTVTIHGSVARSSVQAKFGTYSALFGGASGSTDYLSFPDHIAWDGDAYTAHHTIDFWIYPLSLTTNTNIIGRFGGVGTHGIYAYPTGSIAIGINGTSEIASATGVLTLNSWQHYAVVKSGPSNIKMYKNGVQIGTGTGNFANTSDTLKIGGDGSGASYKSLDGYLDEVRVSQVARWATAFTPNDNTYSTNATGTLISDPQTASSTTECSGVILYTDNAGTNTLGTDLKIYFTANNGTNWTEASSYGTAQTFSGSIKQVKLGKTTVTAGTQVALKAEWANQAAGVGGGTSPIDSSGESHTLTAVDGATTSTAIKYWGTQSMQFDGTGDWYTVPDGSWADLGTGDFTMEAWVYYTGGSGYQGIIGSGTWGGPNYNWSWDMNSADRYPRLSLYNGGSEILVQMTTAIATSTWTHLAVCRSGGTITQYLNGTANGSTVASTHNVASAGVVYIGNQSRGIPWTGNLQEVRMSKNARYTGNFTSFGQDGGTIASPSNFTSDGDTILLVHGEGTAAVGGKVAHLEGWAVNY